MSGELNFETANFVETIVRCQEVRHHLKNRRLPTFDGAKSIASAEYTPNKKPRLAEGVERNETTCKNLRIIHPTSLNLEKKLELVGERAPRATSWVYPLKDETRRSFAGHLRGALPKSVADTFFNVIDKCTPWTWLGPRQTAWMVRHPCSCSYGYMHKLAVVRASTWPNWMDELLEHVMPLCGIGRQGWPNSCNINRYNDGWEGVGWHADDEALFQGAHRDCLIVSLSLGQERIFSLCPDDAWDGWEEGDGQCDRYLCPDDAWKGCTVSVSLGNGDLCTMEGMTQKYYRHAAHICGEEGLLPRLNLTWRWIVRHEMSCALAVAD